MLTALALVAFAGNSILARMALAGGDAGAAAFTAVRLAAGAAVLGPILGLRTSSVQRRRRHWPAALALLVYAAGFSFAYIWLGAGTGALILFAAVQITMLLAAWKEGDRLAGLRLLGLLVALTGLGYLVSPGLASPPPLGSLLMIVAGISWGWYSLMGRSNSDSVGATARNFMLAAPPGLALWLLALLAGGDEVTALTTRGAWLAVTSGALTSGLGYAVWYQALRGLSTVQSATLQLTVPVIAAWGGVVLLAEPVSIRLMASAVLILGGVALTLRRPREQAAQA